MLKLTCQKCDFIIYFVFNEAVVVFLAGGLDILFFLYVPFNCSAQQYLETIKPKNTDRCKPHVSVLFRLGYSYVVFFTIIIY